MHDQLVQQVAKLRPEEADLVFAAFKAMHVYLRTSQGEKTLGSSEALRDIIREVMLLRAKLFSTGQQIELQKLVASCKVGPDCQPDVTAHARIGTDTDAPPCSHCGA